MSGTSEQQYYDDLRASTQQHVDAANFWRGESARHEAARELLLTTAATEKAARDQEIINLINRLNIQGTGQLRKKIQALSGVIENNSLIAGTQDFSMMRRDTGVAGDGYLHLNTDISPSQSIMLLLYITGMDFQGLKVHNANCWAYIGYGGIHSQAKNNDSLDPYFYLGSNGKAHLRLKLSAQYLNSISIDAIMTYNGNVDGFKFADGRITALTTSAI